MNQIESNSKDRSFAFVVHLCASSLICVETYQEHSLAHHHP
jgi:hypothetical protein